MPAGTAEGKLLGDRYRVIERLGAGGMAAVYLAHDERLDRRVAVKRMHGTGGGDEMDARRFEREGKLGASLSHPNLVSIFDSQQDGESVLLVMEYVEGETLGDLLSRGPVEPKGAVKIVRAVAEALDHAHGNGIVHRDIKPGNVLLGKDGSVKLADLGIAKAVERTEITNTGTVLGTPAYMAPEQLEGGEIGPPVDIYALATMAFEMLTGQKARRGRTAVEIAHQVVNEQAPEPCDVNPAVPTAAGDVIKRGMAKDPSKRPSSAVELAEGLEKAFAKAAPPREPTAATRRVERERARPVAPVPATDPAPTPPRAKPPARGSRPAPADRPRWVFAVLGLFALALVAVAIGLASSGGDDSPEQSADRADTPAEKASGKEKKQGEQPASAAPEPEEPVAATGVPQPQGKGTEGEATRLHLAGHRALQAGDYETAIELNTQAIETFPPGTQNLNYAYALYSLGRALRLSGEFDQAVAVLTERAKIPNQTATVQRDLQLARDRSTAP